jgi:hypothetical protein
MLDFQCCSQWPAFVHQRHAAAMLRVVLKDDTYAGVSAAIQAQ